MSNSLPQRVWLSREGKTDGPFMPDQIQAMKASGQYSAYAWVWEEDSKSWKPIHPVPASPVTESPPHIFIPPPRPSTNAVKMLSRPLSAVCHDNRNIVGGTLASTSGQDGVFKTTDHVDAFPPFRKGHVLSVNLLDEASGQSENVQAEIADLKKSEDHWEYRLKWKATPRLIDDVG